MNKLFFLILLCSPMIAFADFSICEDTKSWYVCDEVAGADASVMINTEIVELTSVTGESTQAHKVTSSLKPDNEGVTDKNPGMSTALNTPHEVGWRSS